jgi:peptidoglycan/xylan/chitin deacetylase (PgdA/CDA1 family)
MTKSTSESGRNRNAAPRPTIVSLTFDDGTADQYVVRAMLAQNSIKATFYVNSNKIGRTSPFLTWDELSDLAADGNEVGGHTPDHVDLTKLRTTEATRQVYEGRQALLSRGFPATSFAYPYGARTAKVESIVQQCGYQSARRAWGLSPVGSTPSNYSAVVSETTPPRNVWAIRAAGVNLAHTLSDVQGAVTGAEKAGGGWVVLMFHHISEGRSRNRASVSTSILSSFLDWLASRSAVGTHVRTMSDVVADGERSRLKTFRVTEVAE